MGCWGWALLGEEGNAERQGELSMGMGMGLGLVLVLVFRGRSSGGCRVVLGTLLQVWHGSKKPDQCEQPKELESMK